jgi:hypothetical protein
MSYILVQVAPSTICNKFNVLVIVNDLARSVHSGSERECSEIGKFLRTLNHRARKAVYDNAGKE